MAQLKPCFIFIVALTVVSGNQPSLEIQPNSKSVKKEVGGNLALTCRPNVENPSLISQIEWRDPFGRRIENTNRARSLYVQNLSGEPGKTLIFTGLTEAQKGTYSCHASYDNTEPLKSEIEVMIYVDINFSDAPENQYPVLGKDFAVKCKVTGQPTPTIDWNKNDESITSNNKYVVSNDQLLIKNVTEMDDGVYKCTAVVFSTGQIKHRNIKVEVQIPPKIEPMDPIVVIEGETATAKCHATGKPPPQYSWIKVNERKNLSTTDRFSVKKNTGELIMNRVEFNDDGIYKCVAENTVGRVETEVKINVRVKPNIYELINVTAEVRTETRIICKAHGRPPPQILFRKLSSREPLKEDRRIALEPNYDKEKGESFGTLIISNLSRSDDGLYECIANNTAGTAYKNGHIAVEFPPTFERTKDLPPVWSWDQKPGNLSCLPEAIPNATIIWRYHDIDITEENMMKNLIQRNVFKVMGNARQSFLIVQPFDEKRYYTRYECIAKNKLGQASIKIELKQAFRPTVVNEVRQASLTATTVRFNIVPPTNFEGLPIRSYTVQYKPERTLSWDFAYNHTWSNGAPYILEGLYPEQTYNFRFAARNDVGLGPFRNIPAITMPERSVPNEPKILYSTHRDQNVSNRQNILVPSPYDDHYELRWSVPADNGEPIQHYVIRYCVTEKINGNWHDRDCSEPIQQSVQYTNFQLNQLRPDTVYKIELRAYNAVGQSAPAQLLVRTARGIDPVVPFQKPAMSSSAIIGIVVAAILLVLLVVDVTCYCVNKSGVIALCCERSKLKKADEEDPKLGREEEREPLQSEVEKPMRVEFDGKHVYSKSGEIIGKHSAV